MATETLMVPEENLADVIRVIRSGVQKEEDNIDAEVAEILLKWCEEEEAYLGEMPGTI